MRPPDIPLGEMIDQIPILAWSCRPDGTTEFLNRRWLEYTGLSMDEALGWGWQGAIHPDDLAKLMTTWLRLLASGEAGQEEARLRRFDGTYRWFLFRAVPVRDDHGRIIRWYGTNTDIEDLKRAEEKLRENEAELRQLIEVMPQNILVLGPDRKPLYANQRLLDYHGVALDDVQADDFRARIYHPDDLERVLVEAKRASTRGVPWETEARLLRGDGQYRWFLLRASPLQDESGRITHWYSTGFEIEERKQAEERVHEENLALREEIDHSSMFEEIVGSSAALREVLAQVARVAPVDSTVLILGETGTGKELIARAIHKRSNRSARAFVRVNCAAIPPTLIASELFGHEKGAFTGALQRRLGRFELADGGTIFLDELGELPAETQIALLRVLQEREIERVGGSGPIAVDVRVLGATNRDLKAAVAVGRFREDLFYRLNVFPIQIPSLRERIDDIPLIVEYFIERYAKKAGKKITNIRKKTLELFQRYDWPGNIRELQNVIERAVVLCDGDDFSVDANWLKREERKLPGSALPFTANIAEREKEMIQAALVASRGRVAGPAGAAAKLGIPRQTLESKIKSLGIDKHRFKALRAN